MSTVTQLARAWKDARERVTERRKILVEAVRQAHAAGESEYELARKVGVGRSTIREWLGKGQ